MVGAIDVNGLGTRRDVAQDGAAVIRLPLDDVSHPDLQGCHELERGKGAVVASRDEAPGSHVDRLDHGCWHGIHWWAY